MGEPAPVLQPVDPLGRHKDALVEAVSRAVVPSATVQDVKRLMFVVWKMMPREDRIAFRNRLDPDGVFMSFKPRWPDLDNPQLEDAAREWGFVMAAGSDEEPGYFGPLAEREGQDAWGFAKSIRKHLKFRDWTPTEKQAAWMIEIHKGYRRWIAL